MSLKATDKSRLVSLKTVRKTCESFKKLGKDKTP